MEAIFFQDKGKLECGEKEILFMAVSRHNQSTSVPAVRL